MKRRVILILLTIAVLIVAFFIAYPFIEIDTGERLIRCSYTGDFSDYDVNQSYNELYCYNEKHDVSIRNFDVKNFLFFYTISMEYVEGDFRETQFMLEESYVYALIEHGEIIENWQDIDLASLIEGKTAIVGNVRYTGNDYDNCILFKLNGKYEELYVFETDGLLVIQVGSPDELPKFIAYK